MKVKLILQLVLFCLLVPDCFSQSNWQFVGPKSSNSYEGNPNSDNDFETSQISFMVINPLNSNHFFTGGKFAGLWQSTNAGSGWSEIETSPTTNSNGVSAVAFISSTEIIFSNFFSLVRVAETNGATDDLYHDYSTGIWKYNFSLGTYTSLGSLPNPGNIPYVVNSLAMFPGNSSILFACTSIGLYRSSNGGVSWTRVTTNYVQNIEFAQVNAGYHCFVVGSTSTGVYGEYAGNLSVKKSTDNGASFSEVSPGFTIPAPLTLPPFNSYQSAQFNKSVGKVCKNASGSQTNFYISTVAEGNGVNSIGTATNISYTLFYHFSVSSTGTLTVNGSNLGNFANYGDVSTHHRFGLAYDPYNNGLWHGGVALCFFNLATNQDDDIRRGTNTGKSGDLHMDIHDVTIGNGLVYVSCDGGIGTASLTNGIPNSFANLNNNLNVCLINGFSGHDDSTHLYAIGGQDVVNTDIYNELSGKSVRTWRTWENDGALIDKYDAEYLIYDNDSYNGKYGTSPDLGNTKYTNKSSFLPASGNTFEKGTITTHVNGFVHRVFFQDPYRKGRIYQLKSYSGIHQFIRDESNDANSYFVLKVWPAGIEAPGQDFGIDGWSFVSSMSVSPETKNSMHFTINGDNINRPNVIKYIGPDIDDCWRDHNMATTTINGTTYNQWQSITPASLWSNTSIFGASGVTQAELEKTKFHSIETSPWNKDVVYVGVYIPNHPDIKVLKYNGSTWSNYSNGIPNSEYGMSMILDKQSNDAIYLSTERGVYYRSASSSAWVYYSNNLPHIRSMQMEVNYGENTVRAGTYGRGIWKSNLYCPTAPNPMTNCTNCISSQPNSYWEGTNVQVSATTLSGSKGAIRASEYVLFSSSPTTSVLLTANGNTNSNYLAFIHGCSPSSLNSFRALDISAEEDSMIVPDFIYDKVKESVVLYPNPNKGEFYLNSNFDEDVNVLIYNSLGEKVYEEKKVRLNNFLINSSFLPNGIYMVRCEGETFTKHLSYVKQ